MPASFVANIATPGSPRSSRELEAAMWAAAAVADRAPQGLSAPRPTPPRSGWPKSPQAAAEASSAPHARTAAAHSERQAPRAQRQPPPRSCPPTQTRCAAAPTRSPPAPVSAARRRLLDRQRQQLLPALTYLWPSIHLRAQAPPKAPSNLSLRKRVRVCCQAFCSHRTTTALLKVLAKATASGPACLPSLWGSSHLRRESHARQSTT